MSRDRTGHLNGVVSQLSKIMSELQSAGFQQRPTIAETTPTSVLAELATDTEAQIRQAIARNSNTAVEVLAELGEEFPNEITENPIFKVLLLKNPNFL